MNIILAPAKKMIVDTDNLAPVELPVYIDKTAEVLNWMKSKSKEELKAIWKCNDKLAEQNFNRLENMDLYNRLTYRLEMQAKVGIGDAKNLYEYWGCLLYTSSKDSVASHKRFEEKYGLAFTLLADPERKVIEAYDCLLYTSGRNSNIYPLSRVRGVIPANHIFKDKDNVVLKK